MKDSKNQKKLKKFLNSFVFAWCGIRECFFQEQNFRFHTVAGIFALILSGLLRISAIEWCLILLVIAFVLSAELINTVIEKFADFVEPNHNEKIRMIKDIAAGMVLITAIGALLVGVIIFLPKLWQWMVTLL